MAGHSHGRHDAVGDGAVVRAVATRTRGMHCTTIHCGVQTGAAGGRVPSVEDNARR